MKKKLFVFMLLMCVLLAGVPSVAARAEEVHIVTNGVRISSNYTMDTTDDGKYLYTFTLVVESDDPTTHGVTIANSILWYGYEGDGDFFDDIEISSTDKGKQTRETTSIDGVDTVTKTTVIMTYESEELYYDSTEYNNFLMNVKYQIGVTYYYYCVYFTLNGDIPDITDTPTPTPEPTETPTPTPEPTETPTPTPEPTPEPEPAVSLDVDINGFNSTCTYYTGGMDSVSSYFELQWYMYGKDDPDGIYDTMDRVTFVDGRGTYKYELKQGEWYRAMVSYTYIDSDGVQQTKEIYSDFFQGDDGGSPVVIWNLKSLLDWVWKSLMEIEITYEGFTVTFKQIFLFSLIAPTLILFVCYFVGMYGIGFLFGHHWSFSDKDDTISYSEKDVIGSTIGIEENLGSR